IYADELGLRMPVEIRLGAEKIAGEITAISPEVIDHEVIARVRFKDKTPKKLRQNQRLSARIILTRKEGVLSLPRGAYLDSQRGRAIWKVEGDTASVQDIQIGIVGSQNVELVSGLRVNDTVVLSNMDHYHKAKTLFLTQ
ncbi:MAG: efflux RND transporter periplasmic adaptor subunit, partial [Spongiibacteraceae bacterium]|nr:efflux RND transporter periplasmic adaptor subunit [Spongiibacteraceae bacterium]